MSRGWMTLASSVPIETTAVRSSRLRPSSRSAPKCSTGRHPNCGHEEAREIVWRAEPRARRRAAAGRRGARARCAASTRAACAAPTPGTPSTCASPARASPRTPPARASSAFASVSASARDVPCPSTRATSSLSPSAAAPTRASFSRGRSLGGEVLHDVSRFRVPGFRAGSRESRSGELSARVAYTGADDLTAATCSVEFCCSRSASLPARAPSRRTRRCTRRRAPSTPRAPRAPSGTPPTNLAAAVKALAQADAAANQRDYRLALNHALDSREQAQNAARAAATGRAAARSRAERLLAEVTTALATATARLDAADAAKLPDDRPRRTPRPRSRRSRKPCKKRARRSGGRTISPPPRRSTAALTRSMPQPRGLTRLSPPRRPAQPAAGDNAGPLAADRCAHGNALRSDRLRTYAVCDGDQRSMLQAGCGCLPRAPGLRSDAAPPAADSEQDTAPPGSRAATIRTNATTSSAMP